MILGRELGFDDDVAAAEAEEKERLNGKKYGSMDEDPFMGGDTFTGNSPPTPGSMDHFLDDMYLPVKKEHIPPPAPIKGPAQDSNKPADSLERTVEIVPNATGNSVAEISSTTAVDSIQFEQPRHGIFVKTTNLLTGTEIRGAQTSSSHEFLTPICPIDETTYALAQEVRDSFAGAEEHELRAVMVAEELEVEEQARARALLLETEHSNILHPSEHVPEHAQKNETLTDERLMTAVPSDNAHGLLDSAETSQESGASQRVSVDSSSERPLNTRAQSQLPKLQSPAAQQDDSLFSIAERTANLAAFKELMESLTSSVSGSKNQPEPSAIAKTYSASDISNTQSAPKKLQETKKKGHEYDGAAAEKIPVTRHKTGIPLSSAASTKKAKAIPVPVKNKIAEKVAGTADAKAPKESRLPMRARTRK